MPNKTGALKLVPHIKRLSPIALIDLIAEAHRAVVESRASRGLPPFDWSPEARVKRRKLLFKSYPRRQSCER